MDIKQTKEWKFPITITLNKVQWMTILMKITDKELSYEGRDIYREAAKEFTDQLNKQVTP